MFTHEPAVKLAESLLAVAPPGLARVFYGDNGSSAIEIALKMSFHYWRNQGQAGKRRFIALRGGSHVYHLFVRSDRHRRGIAGALWRQAKTLSGHDTFTVRSSLYAEPVYARLGFVREAPPRTDNGVTWVAMRHAGG